MCVCVVDSCGVGESHNVKLFFFFHFYPFIDLLENNIAIVVVVNQFVNLLFFFALQFIYRVFDRDGNGFITRDELQTAMEMIGEPLTETQLTQLLAIADLDQDGRIDYEGKWKIPFFNLFPIKFEIPKDG